MPDTNELYNFIFRMDKRLDMLYKDTAYIEKLINSVGKEGKNKYLRLNAHREILKIYLEEIRDSLRICNRDMLKIAQSLRYAVKKDQLDRLSAQTDELEIQDYVTYKELAHER